MTLIYVVMGNDYPAAVFDTESAAADYCRREKDKNDKRLTEGYGKIYWRAYGFPLNNGAR